MQHQKNSLFEAFHADHATLGRGFHELSQSLRAHDLGSARDIADRIDAQAGAHVAFEEEHFYKALLPLLGEAEVGRMYEEHRRGLKVVRSVLQLASSKQPLEETVRVQLVHESEAMQTHIAECGGLFEAMGRIPVEEQAVLYQHLLKWREANPRWTDFAASHASDHSA